MILRPIKKPSVVSSHLKITAKLLHPLNESLNLYHFFKESITKDLENRFRYLI